MLNKKIIAKLVVLCCLAFGFIYFQPSVQAARSDCPAYCPEMYGCNPLTGQCECICPNLDGSCPISCV